VLGWNKRTGWQNPLNSINVRVADFRIVWEKKNQA